MLQIHVRALNIFFSIKSFLTPCPRLVIYMQYLTNCPDSRNLIPRVPKHISAASDHITLPSFFFRRCHICDRGFSKITNLRNHLFLHTGEHALARSRSVSRDLIYGR